MFEYIYQWIHNLSIYMILMTAVLQVLPSEKYKKYIQFYMGLVILLLLCSPLLKILGMEEEFVTYYSDYSGQSYEALIGEIEAQTEYLNEVELDDYISGEMETDG